MHFRPLSTLLVAIALTVPATALAADSDGDGYDSTIDCDDANPRVYPGAPEIPDGLDNDCDGLVDEGTTGEAHCSDGLDDDGDGYVDCMDPDCFADPACAPPSETDCSNGLDDDGDGYTDCADRDCFGDPACGGTGVDADGDGYDSSVDCDDADPLVYPGARELCDGLDNDCNGLVDDGCGTPCDADGDGHIDWVCGGTDCNDRDPAIYPGAPELCDGLDNDCDGVADEGCTTPADADSDGYDDVATGGTDCDDTDPSVHPGATEACNGVDDDCDGVVDEGCPTTTDADGDGYDGWEYGGPDCEDTDAAVHPCAIEVCDDQDNDCDGMIDEACAEHAGDADGDGYIDEAAGCDDCDDGDPAVFPGAEELCNEIDDDCDGSVDEGCPGPDDDADGDGFIDVAAGGDDCDDDDASVNPGAAEVCDDGIDDDCDGLIDGEDDDCAGDTGEPGPTDGDGDGYDEAVDCDDSDATVHPGAVEACNGRDDDCDGAVDEGCDTGDTGIGVDEDKDDRVCGCHARGTRLGQAAGLLLALLGLTWRRRP